MKGTLAEKYPIVMLKNLKTNLMNRPCTLYLILRRRIKIQKLTGVVGGSKPPGGPAALSI
jgi:hypothetical protein